MTAKSDIQAEALRLRALFEAQGAEVFETAILQPAGALLGLYGEDIRARAFVTHDPLRGEMMLRPDFTVPLVQHHMDAGRDAARYTYAGEVFRRQEEDDARPTEYIQVGYEAFGETDEEAADADVFKVMSDALDDLPLTATIGDFGVIHAAIESLDTPDRRKRALHRHIWRPVRFRVLLDRFSRPAPPPPDPVGDDVPHVGLRSREEIDARLQLLAEEAATAPITQSEVRRINAVLGVKDIAPAAVAQLKAIAGTDTLLSAAVRRIEARIGALSDHGIDPADLLFEASYGLTSLEYYTGFVFGFSSTLPGDLPVVASGGRYDLLTSVVGHGRAMPAVGGVIRPDAVLALRKGGR
jgi:ATP phosphoribosyltransferase regulatory subunit